jgi:hypothetical protein
MLVAVRETVDLVILSSFRARAPNVWRAVGQTGDSQIRGTCLDIEWPSNAGAAKWPSDKVGALNALEFRES